MRVDPLDPSRHDRKDFDCGRPELNDWLARQARQSQHAGSARTFVLTDDGEKIFGYYALSSHSVDFDAVSLALSKGQSRHFPIPAVLLARLAVALSHQGQKLGERLLADAVRRAVAASENLGIALIVVDALDDDAAAFYEKYGFQRWPADSLRLFAKVGDMAATFSD